MNFIIFVGDLKSDKIWQNQIENKVKVKKKEFKGENQNILSLCFLTFILIQRNNNNSCLHLCCWEDVGGWGKCWLFTTES